MNIRRVNKQCMGVLLVCVMLFQSTPAVSTTISPLFDLTLELDGTDDYASAPDHDSLDLGTEGDFTIEAFFYVIDPAQNYQDVLVWKNGAYGLKVVYASDDLPDRIVFSININPNDTRQVFYNLELTAGWYHVAAVFDEEFTAGEYLLAIFLDGKQVSTFAGIDYLEIPNTSAPVTIGANGGANPTRGWLEEVRFSDGVRYSETTSIKPTAPFSLDDQTRALWHFDEVWDATIFQDGSANGNTLTGVNGAQIGNPTGEIPPPLSFGKLSPVDQATLVSITPSLAWESSTGATGYQVCIEPDENGICDGSWIDAGSNTSFVAPSLDIYTQYQWQVRASNLVSATVADGGHWWSFTTEDSGQPGPGYTVTNSMDEFDGLCGIKHCTLREAVYAAEMDDVASIIELQSETLYTLSSATPDAVYGNSAFPAIRGSLTIQGHGAVIERDPSLLCKLNTAEEASEFRLLRIASTGEMTINQVTLRYGCSDGNLAINPETGLGSAIYNQGILALDQTTLVNNQAYQGGGAIYNDSNAVLKVDNSTFTGNLATLGGGGFLNAGSASLTNSTLTKNSTARDGGALNNLSTGILRLNFVTITENFAGVNGGGIANLSGGSVEQQNSLLGNNIDIDSDAPDCAGNIVSMGYNLVEDTTGCDFIAQMSDILHENPYLLPLADNGGSTPTHALWVLSPAIDRIPSGENGCGTSSTTDQRGVERPIDANNDGDASCDIGAVEMLEGSTILHHTFLSIILR